MDIKFKGFYSMQRHKSVEIKIPTVTLLQTKDHSKLFLLFAVLSSYFKNNAMTNIAEFKGSNLCKGFVDDNIDMVKRYAVPKYSAVH